MMCGGAGKAVAADEDTKQVCEKVKPDVEAKANRKFDVYEAIQVSTQVVAGTNFFVKIHVGNEEYIHVRIFRPLPHTGGAPELHAHQLGKKKEDPIGYFE